MKVFSSFTDAYHELILDVSENPDFISSPRGQKVKEKLGVTFKIKNPLDRIPYVESRDFSITYYVAESLWYLSGNDSTSWISNYSSFWKNISDDGLTANSAYGSRIFRPHPRIASQVNEKWTQWNYVIDELVNDNDSRRAVIHIRSPHDSIMASKDVPCTLSLQFFLRQDQVHMVVSMRSSDLILGIAYDVPAFTLFQELLAKDLSKRLNRPIGVGEYTHTSNSLHIYERHFDMVQKITTQNREKSIEMPKMPDCDIPIGDLMNFENELKNSTTLSQLHTLLKSTNSELEYWNDWKIILTAHRASKIEKDSFKEFLDLCSFSGYKKFSK